MLIFLQRQHKLIWIFLISYQQPFSHYLNLFFSSTFEQIPGLFSRLMVFPGSLLLQILIVCKQPFLLFNLISLRGYMFTEAVFRFVYHADRSPLLRGQIALCLCSSSSQSKTGFSGVDNAPFSSFHCFLFKSL